MKVLILSSQTVEEVNDSYGARLIEQGKAVIPPQAEEKAEEKPAENPAEEAPTEAPAKGKRK